MKEVEGDILPTCQPPNPQRPGSCQTAEGPGAWLPGLHGLQCVSTTYKQGEPQILFVPAEFGGRRSLLRWTEPP